jgi:hypothetical protein
VRLVVDASVVVKWFVEENGQSDALSILERGDECFAPDHVVVEVAGALDKKHKAKAVTREQAIEAISAIQEHLTLIAGTRLVTHAFDIAADLPHPLADCLYLACALEIDAPMVTADTLFLQRAIAAGYARSAIALGDMPTDRM